MAITAKQLGQMAITTGATTLYTVPVSTKAILKSFDICNTTNRQIDVRVFIIPSGGSATTGTALFYDYPIPSKRNLPWEGEQVLEASGFIQARASATGCTITASGVEIT